MKRRSAIKISLGSIGFCLTGATLSAVMGSCKHEPSDKWIAKIFDKDQSKLVEQLVDIIIPRTENSPGAVDALVHRYLDEAVSDYFTDKERGDFLNMLNAFDQSVQLDQGKSFVKLDRENQIGVIQNWADSSDDFKSSMPGEKHGFLQLRNLVKHAYFSSEVACKEVLNYDPVPGGYDGCTSLPENGAAWARLAG